MKLNEDVVNEFYSAFAKLDYKTMQDCYSDDPVFNDPVFGIVQGSDVKLMWEKLCRNAKDFILTYDSVKCDGEYCTCNWTARYTFSKTGRKVVNNVRSFMRIVDGKITEHTDDFNIYKWSRQALGLTGILLGWSGYLKNKIRRQARNLLIR